MPAKFVFVTELHSDKTKNGKDYIYLLDQDKTRWNLFNGEKVELNKGCVFDFEVKGEYQNVTVIKPVVNIFKQEVMKEIADLNSIKRDIIVCISYVKDLIVADKIPLVEWDAQSEKIYRYMLNFSQGEYDKTQVEKPKIE
jgi:hypothetical protein